MINGRAVRAVTLNGLMMAANRRPEVTFCPIFDCVDDSKGCLKEGGRGSEGWIYCILWNKGRESGSCSGTYYLHALSVQTSDIRGKPHQVEASVKKDEFTAVT